MKINYKVVSGILLLALAWDAKAYLHNKNLIDRIKRSRAAIEQDRNRVLQQRDDARAVAKYLGSKLNENGIPITAFDDIVMSNHNYR